MPGATDWVHARSAGSGQALPFIRCGLWDSSECGIPFADPIMRVLIFTFVFVVLTAGALCAPAEDLRKDLATLIEPSAYDSYSYEACVAYAHLGNAGEDSSWRVLFEALFDVTEKGDAARRIYSAGNAHDRTSFIQILFLFDSWGHAGTPRPLSAIAISAGQLKRLQRAVRAETAKRAKDEAWALQYATACERSGADKAVKGRGELSRAEVLDGLFDDLAAPAEVPEPLLLSVAFLRIHLADRPDFPGHSFPWNGTARQQREAVKGVLTWWEEHRSDFHEEGEPALPKGRRRCGLLSVNTSDDRPRVRYWCPSREGSPAFAESDEPE
jgi:hypothetical protein